MPDSRTLGERSIFLEAIEITSAEERSRYLDAACGGDPTLRGGVEALLGAHRRPQRWLDAADRRDPDDEGLVSEWHPGDVIGPYRLLDELGEGGMGVVYRADQAEPVRRRVALKFIKPGMDSRQVVARFEAERQALAMMDHPNVARVHDAGTTASGRPYFVMELVEGTPIIRHCDRARLTIPERLDLFVQVCRAVQHAHQKGIIHRDLKPSNILITLVDGEAVPKVIDFGIAKILGETSTDRTSLTRASQRFGTPLYMSPEQAGLAEGDVDTRSDIYALGVLLYELLTGTTPIDRETFQTAAHDDFLRLIRDWEPPTPSARVNTLGAALAAVSASRQLDPRRLGQAIRGELDWIAMKALEKDRNRRYGTASDLAADVRRHLSHQPVEAGPPSVRYRCSRYARRHRATLIPAALAGLALLAGTAASTWQAIRATRASAESLRRAEESRRVVEYLVDDVFGAATPERIQGRTPTIVDMLDAADATISRRFDQQPLVEAAVRMALGRAFDIRAEYDRAARQIERATALRLSHLGFDHPDTLMSLTEHMHWVATNGRRDEGIALGRAVLSARRRVLGATHPDTLYTLAALARMLGHSEPHRAEAVQLATEATVSAARVLGPDHFLTYNTLDVLGMIHARRGDPERAEQLLRRAVAGYDRILGPLHWDTMWGYKRLSRILEQQGRLADARRFAVENLERVGRAYGAVHGQAHNRLKDATRLLIAERNPAGLRELSERWIRLVFDAPTDASPSARSRRAGMLRTLALSLAILPEPVAFDAGLARRAADEAVALDEADPEGWRVLGLVRYRLGQYDQAQEALRDATRRTPGQEQEAVAAFADALIRARLGEVVAARSRFDRAVDLAAALEQRSRPDDLRPQVLRQLRAEAAAALSRAQVSSEEAVRGEPAREEPPG